MKLRNMLLVCCVLLPAQVLAQSRAADPISGTWTGYMGRTDTERITMTVELKFDGKTITGTVTGPQLQPGGDIKTGTFDASTGVLKFQVTVRGDGNLVAFDGKVDQGVATGRVTVQDSTGMFKLTKQVPGAPGAASAGTAAGAAAPTPANDTAAAARRSFTEVSGWVTRAADLVPADKYTYRPTQTVRTFGQVIGHLADSYNYYCARAGGKNAPWSDAIEKGTTDKASLVAKLKQSLEVCNAAYAGTGQMGPLIENVGHTNLHYGNLITYIRMLGLVPPSS